MTTPAAKAKTTRRVKSLLMTDFLRMYEKYTGARISIDLIRSPEWRALQDEYIRLFMPLVAEKGTRNDHQEGK